MSITKFNKGGMPFTNNERYDEFKTLTEFIRKGNVFMGITMFNKGDMLFTNTERYEEFKTLKELYEENGKERRYLVTALYTYNSVYGYGCFAKSEGFNISLPSHMVETVKEIRKDKESIEQINNGEVFIEIYTYSLPDKYPGKKFYSVNFVLSK